MCGQKRIRVRHGAAALAALALSFSGLYAVYRMASGPAADGRQPGDYAMMAAQCLFGVGALSLPWLLERKTRLILPDSLHTTYALFLFAAIYLGEVQDFYQRFPHWDNLLHLCSGVLLSVLGFSLYAFLYGGSPGRGTPARPVLFAFCLAVALGAVWELYEYTLDGLLGSNMQYFAALDGVPLVGRAALEDTMCDLAMDTLGGAIGGAAVWVALRKNSGWLDKVRIRRRT